MQKVHGASARISTAPPSKKFVRLTTIRAAMKLTAILSTSAAALCLALSIWLFFVSSANSQLQLELRTKQEGNQTLEQALRLQRQQLEAQQEQIKAGTRLAQDLGPAVLRDLGALALRHKNEKVKALLAKYGVSVSERDAAPKGRK